MRDSSLDSGSDGLMTPLSQSQPAPSVLNRIAIGERDAALECISLYGDLVWSICNATTGSRDAAENATFNIFESIWRSARNYDASGLDEKVFVVILARRSLEKAGFRIPAATDSPDPL